MENSGQPEQSATIVISSDEDEDAVVRKVKPKAAKKVAQKRMNGKNTKAKTSNPAPKKKSNGQQSIRNYFNLNKFPNVIPNESSKAAAKLPIVSAAKVKDALLPSPSRNTPSIIRSPQDDPPAIDSTKSGATKEKRKKRCPEYKVVEGTRFAVDAFQFGDIPNVEYYFLTHFHADHYVGLRKSFSHPLFVSRITARLVAEFVGVDANFVHEVDIDVPFEVDGVEIIALDANHCPGAVMFLFRRTTATGHHHCTLHTGDFRASPHMETYPAFWNHRIDTLYLDTTYLSTKAAFIPQHDSLANAQRAVHRFLAAPPPDGATPLAPPLIVCGTYLIGKEKVWMSIADTFDLRVWLEPQRRRALACIYPADHPIYARLTDSPEAATLHVLSMQRIGYQQMRDYAQSAAANASAGSRHRVLVLRPSGWERDTTHRVRPAAAFQLLGVEYSEHSSYAEMERFVRYLRPARVVSTVPLGGGDLCRTAAIPAQWLAAAAAAELKPQRQEMQLNIQSFLVGGGNGSSNRTK